MSNRRLKRIRDYISLFLSRLQRNFWCFWVKIQDDIILFFANGLLAILKLIGYAALFLGLILMLGHFCLVDIHISRARITLQSQCPEPVIEPKPAVSFKTQAGQL